MIIIDFYDGDYSLPIQSAGIRQVFYFLESGFCELKRL